MVKIEHQDKNRGYRCVDSLEVQDDGKRILRVMTQHSSAMQGVQRTSIYLNVDEARKVRDYIDSFVKAHS